MSELNLIRAAFLSPLVDGLMSVGVPVAPLIRRSGLDRFRIDNPNADIPLNLYYEFFDVVSRREGVEDLAADFAGFYSIFKLGDWGDALLTFPNLLELLTAAVRYSASFETTQRFGLEVSGARASFSNWYVEPLSAGRTATEAISLKLILDLFRLVGGKDWEPLEIHLTNFSPRSLVGHRISDSTRVRVGQPRIALVVHTTDLALSIPVPETGQTSNRGLTDAPTTLGSKLERLLDALDGPSALNSVQVASFLDISSRTLQRRLANEGTTISSVVDNWRFKNAVRMLENPSMQIYEISERLFYTDPANFVRAFRRWVDATPSQYREELANL